MAGVYDNTLDREKVIEYAALAESSSSHPISRSLQKAYGKEIDRNRVTDIEEISGHGITAKVDGISVAAGNYKLMKKLGLSYSETDKVGTIVHIAIDGRYEGDISGSNKGIEKSRNKRYNNAYRRFEDSSRLSSSRAGN